MAAITADMQTVAKNLEVETGKNKSYKAVSERDILDAVKPLEKKYGVYSYPFSRDVIESQTLESESEYNGKVTKKTTFFSRIKTVYRFVNAEKPEEYIDIPSFSEGIDAQDKGSGKAMTYADKYALMKAYKISTGDDPDQEASREERYTTKKQGGFINKYTCSGCGEQILGVATSQGNFSRDEVLARTTAKYGKALCWDCAKKANEN